MERLGEMQWHIYEYSTNLRVDLKKIYDFFYFEAAKQVVFLKY